ncbi:MAG: hypothetical protein ABEL76_04555 [Bradymonadaceae bacterium]
MMVSRRWIAVVAGVFAVCASAPVSAADPVKNPTGDATDEAKEEKKGEKAVEVPAVKVSDEAKRTKANEPIGEYDQPSWTLDRPFSSARAYVNPPGETEINVFHIPTMNLSADRPSKSSEDGGGGGSEESVEKPTFVENTTEIELETGIGHRLQVDYYLVMAQETKLNPKGADTKKSWGDMHVAEQKFELRWAFADWGKIWGNPTLYAEFAHGGGPPSVEPKLLLSGNLSNKLFGAANLVWERKLGGEEKEQEYGLTLALNYLVSDPELFAGVEAVVETADTKEKRFDFKKYEVLGGPSLQWYPMETVHVGLNPKVGVEIEKEEGETESKVLFQPMVTLGYAI